MRKLIFILALLICTAATSAEQAFQCVNPDVLNSLLFNARPESKLVVKRTMPDIVDGFRAPAEFTLIGSGVRGENLSTVVAYRTKEESGKAFESLLGFLSSEGWRREVIAGAQTPPVSVASPQPLAARLCRNGERRNLLVQEIDGVRYATIFGFEITPPRACGVVPAQQNFQSNPLQAINALRGDMPQFSLPDNAHAVNAFGGDNLTSSNIVSSTTRIESPDTAASLAAYLARQVVSQGWHGDAQWKGELSNGSTWSRRNSDGKVYWGTLEIVSFGGGTYEVRFSMIAGHS